jgi:hypothetical protein
MLSPVFIHLDEPQAHRHSLPRDVDTNVDAARLEACATGRELSPTVRPVGFDFPPSL